MTDLWKIEADLLQGGVTSLCGVDEAGRGPLAGPVFAAAVILPHGLEIQGLNDSKKISEKKREALFGEICSRALDYAIASASVEEIEAFNILGATYLAMNRAISGLHTPPALALIDGDRCKGITYPCQCVIHGDGTCASIAAASILAKVSRDRLMLEYEEQYPLYGFAKHKGYGTKQHREALLTHGFCEIHRPSFLKKIYGEDSKWKQSLRDALESRRQRPI